MNADRAAIAVYSQVRAGHVPAYHRLFVKHFAALGVPVLDVAVPATRNWLARAATQLDRWGWLRGRRAWRGAGQRVRAAERAAGRRAGAVFFVYLDHGFLEPAISGAAVDRWFAWPWAGVVNGPRAVRAPGAAFPDGEAVLAAHHCRAVVVTDEEFVAPVRQTWPGRRVIAMPEVADLTAPGEPAALAELRTFARGRRLVGSVGVVSAKKNLRELLALARHAQGELPGTAFFVAGDFSANACPGPERRELQRLLAQRPENVAMFPAPLTDGAEFNAWVVACDVVWLAYRDVAYKSNVLTKAAHFRRPVLVSAGRVMAAHTERFNLGEVIDAEDTGAALAALRRVLAAPSAGRDFAGFSALNAESRLARTAAELKESLDL